MRRALRRVVHEETALQIAPMIDVTLLLLFFFMLSGKITEGAKLMTIGLPIAVAGQSPKEMGDRDIVNLDAGGQLYAGDRLVSVKELTAHLKERFRNSPPLKLYVRADAATPASRIKQVMRIASEAGAVEVIFGITQGSTG